MNLLQDMLRDVVERGTDEETALSGLRSLSRWYGGQQLYIPVKKEGKLAEEIRGVISDAVGDCDAEKILEVILSLYGGVSHYIPLESRAFKKQIALEIFKNYDGKTESLRDFCRQYNMSYTQVYRLWYEGQTEAKQLTFDFEERF